MIRINLLDETEDKTALYVLQTFAYCCVLVVAFGACAVYQSDLEEGRSFLSGEKFKLTKELKSLQVKTKEVRDLQDKEKLLKEKLSTIALLKARKHGPVHVLHDLAMAIPEEAWVGEISENKGALEIYGAALDEHVVAAFMYNLEKSRYFESVSLIQSQLFVYEEVVGKRRKSYQERAGSGRGDAYGIKKSVTKFVSREENITRETRLKKFSLSVTLANPLLIKNKEQDKGAEGSKS
jgi:type IV pilus assembly protein PilN